MLCLVSVFFHELGHLIMMFAVGERPYGLELGAFNIKIIKKGRYTLSFRNNFLITAAGPAVNFILYLAFIFLNKKFAYVNLFIGLFNLLPAASLDGGQMLFLLLTRRISEEMSVKLMDGITLIVSALLFFFGTIILLYSKYNFSLLFISLYLLLTVLLKRDKYL